MITVAEEEQSIKEQIAAMEGWAIRAKELYETAGNFNGAIEQLRLINTQGRRLEWRGGNSGLKHLPRLRAVKGLKKNIMEARAAAQEAQSAASYFLESKVSESKKQKYKKIFTKQVTILIYLLQKARKIADNEPWFDFNKVLSQDVAQTDLFHPGGYYARYAPEVQKRMIIKALQEGLAKPFCGGLDLSECNFRGLDLRKASFYHANLERANFTGANLEEANFDFANLKNAVFVDANLARANFKNAIVDGMNLEGADIFYARGLDPLTMYKTKNYRKAKNIRSLPGFI